MKQKLNSKFTFRNGQMIRIMSEEDKRRKRVKRKIRQKMAKLSRRKNRSKK